jgi:hypothetical protein
MGNQSGGSTMTTRESGRINEAIKTSEIATRVPSQSEVEELGKSILRGLLKKPKDTES